LDIKVFVIYGAESSCADKHDGGEEMLLASPVVISDPFHLL
jgi:hypothetical protein